MSLTLYPAASGDDSFWVNNNFYNAETSLNVGKSTTYAVSSMLRFPNVTIAPGSVINSAILTLYAFSTGNDDTVSGTLKGHKVANPAAPTSSAEFTNYSNASTTATVAWTAMAHWVTNTGYASPDIKTIIAELIAQTAWASGNAIQLCFADNASSNSALRVFHSYDGGLTAYYPKLVIDFTPNYDVNFKTRIIMIR